MIGRAGFGPPVPFVTPLPPGETLEQLASPPAVWHTWGVVMHARQIGVLACALGPAQLFMVPCALAVVVRHDRPDNAYLQLAQSNQVLASSVGTLAIGTGPGTSLASGTLIAPGWVLTVAHPISALTPASSVRFSVGDQESVAAQVIRHPSWSGAFLSGFDLALVRLQTPLTSSAMPALWRSTDGPLIGRLGLWAGTGRTGDGLIGDALASTALRAFTNTIDDQAATPSGLATLLRADFDGPDVGQAGPLGLGLPTDLEGSTAPGDSGGPLLVQDALGAWRIAGVHSYILNQSPRAGYRTVMASTSIAPLEGWIAQTIPAPGSATALALLGLVAARRHRRGAA